MKLKWLARLLGLVLVASLLASGPLRAQEDTVMVRRALALPLPKGYADVVIAPNPVDASLAVSGSLGALSPAAGKTVQWRSGERLEWRAISADAKGWFSDSVLAGCYVYCSVEMNRNAVMILQAMGNEIAYVNGAPRAGNPYCLKDERESWEPGFDYSFLPVMLEKGANEFVFRCVRDRLKVRLYPSAKPVFFNTRDMTVPDFVAGERIDTWGAIVVVNASTEPLRDLLIRASIPNAGVQVAPVLLGGRSRRKPLIENDGLGRAGQADFPDGAGAVRVRVINDSVLREFFAGVHQFRTSQHLQIAIGNLKPFQTVENVCQRLVVVGNELDRQIVFAGLQ